MRRTRCDTDRPALPARRAATRAAPVRTPAGESDRPGAGGGAGPSLEEALRLILMTVLLVNASVPSALARQQGPHSNEIGSTSIINCLTFGRNAGS